ncbi:hypothetical protein QOZ80_1AG0024120 [Eleusine coracana subsp. coracana]|nr:hypothetical protein QOZ80_1AG0024120 [Eleusine coracana subsp. coracana]
MRLPSSAILRRAAAMSSSFYGRGQRGGYPRSGRGRGYSAHTSRPPHPDAGAEFVSGDSHQSAVRAANDSLRRGGAPGPPPPYRQGHLQQQPHRQGPHYQQPYGQGPRQHPPYGYNYGYGYSQPQQAGPLYGAVPYNYGHPQQRPPPLPPGPQQYGYGAPNPYFHGHQHPQPHGHAPGNAGFYPAAPQLTPRLPDYRRLWRHAKQGPSHQAEKFSVLSYNILADYLAQKHKFLYEGTPRFFLDWNHRKNQLVFEFGLWKPDILCLQEVDKFTDLEQELARREYSGICKMRTGIAADGCAIFWRTTRFQLRYEEDIEFNKLGLRDNVAQICVLESVAPSNAQTDSHSPSHPEQAKQIVVCNTHVLYNPKRGDIKLGQVRTLLDRAYTVSKMWNNAPVVICGDFNSTPKSPLYNFLSEQKLNLSGLAKSTISGQQTNPGPQGLYIGSNISRPHPSFNSTNSKEGHITLQNGFKLQTGTTKMVQNSSPTGKGPVLTDTSLESRNTESNNSCGNMVPCSGSTNLDKQELLNSLEGSGKDCYTSDAGVCTSKTEGEEGTSTEMSSEGCIGMIRTESGEEAEVTGVPSARATVCGEILQSGSNEIVNSTHLPPFDESFGLMDSLEELGGSKKVSCTHRDSTCDAISEEFTCSSEENRAQSDELLPVSKDNPDDKEKALESMLPGQDNCTTNKPESCNSSASQSFTYELHQISNMRLGGDSNTEATRLELREEQVHQSNGSIADASGNDCTSGVMDKNSISCGDESEDNIGAFQDETTANEVFCTDVNSDPTFFEELTGVKDSLLEEEGDGSPSSQQMGLSDESYYSYDPYKWTPDEIRAATGKDECIYVEHKLKLRSAYTDVEDFGGTKYANKEPLVTSYNSKFMGTVDYIWASEDLQTVKVLDTFPKEILKQTSGFPTKKWASDHIALVCELAFTK